MILSPDEIVSQTALRLQKLAERWGHPAWSRSWAEQVAREALGTAEEIQPTVPRGSIDMDTYICLDCGGLADSFACSHRGHGLALLSDLIDCYSGMTGA